MKNYELMVIVDPTLSEEEKTANLDSLKAILEEAGAKIEKEDVWGEKKLAYKINKQNKWFYVLFNLELDWTKIKEISKKIKK